MDVDTRTSGPNLYANYAVLRVKRALWGGSYIGVMGIDKRSGNPFDSFNQTEAADTRLVFFKNLVLNAYATQTRTPGFSSGQTNVGAGFNYQTNWLEVLAQRRKVGANFNPEVGFFELTDCICDYLDVNHQEVHPHPGSRNHRWPRYWNGSDEKERGLRCGIASGRLRRTKSPEVEPLQLRPCPGAHHGRERPRPCLRRRFPPDYFQFSVTRFQLLYPDHFPLLFPG